MKPKMVRAIIIASIFVLNLPDSKFILQALLSQSDYFTPLYT